MTWKSFQDEAFQLTEAEVEKFTPYIVEQYKLAMKSIDAKLKTIYAGLAGVKPEDFYNEMLKYDRLTKLYESINTDYIYYSKMAGKQIEAAGMVAMSNNFYRMQYTHKWLVPGLDFAILPDNLIQLSVLGSTEAYMKYNASIEAKILGTANLYFPQSGTLSEILISNRIKEIEGIQRAITHGLAQGQGYKKTSAAVSEVIGQYVTKDGVPSTTGAVANAERIVRTESTRIMNEAALANTEYARSEGIDIVRHWNAAIDGRTRASHARLDNKPEDEQGLWHTEGSSARYPGGFWRVGLNARCRCSVYDSVDGSEPQIRAGLNPVTGEREVFEFKDFDTWATDNGLTKNIYGELYKK